MEIFCIKEIKRNEMVVFRRFYHYHAVISVETLEASNEQGERHTLFSIRDPEGWKWFHEHFA